MKCGILIIGSLLWDGDSGRADWREQRLETGARMPVSAPIYYGRKSGSRGNTFTMTFRQEDPSGVAALVPCQRQIETIDDLKAEAEALWKAEAPKSASSAIGSGWGCVGALFASHQARETLAGAWRAHFRKVRMGGLSVVTSDGDLNIISPENTNGGPVDLDVILATATKPVAVPPAAHTVADAWLGQDGGYERYFLENVHHGIRTAHDLEIWHRIEAAAPRWLETDSYSEAMKILRYESRGS